MFEHEARTSGTDIQPRWLRIPASAAYCGLSRAGLYILLRTGAIRSTMVYTTSSARGVRVVDRFSIDAYLEHLMMGPNKMAPTWRDSAQEKKIQAPKQRKAKEVS
jgi:hypothetical protein